MSTYIQIQPAEYSAGYSELPLMIWSQASTAIDNFNYIINVAYNEAEVVGVASIVDGDNLYTRLTFAAFHPYKEGDIILFDDSINGDVYSGYYTVMKNETVYNVLINRAMTQPHGANNGSTYNVIKYKFPKNSSDKVTLDIQNTIKDFVTSDLEDTNEIFPGDSTMFKYKLLIGEEYEYSLRFTDNFAGSGGVGFHNPGYTSLTDIPFRINDRIEIKQDLFNWLYYDNLYSNGDLGFTGPGNHNFEEGQMVTVTGQSTHPEYNGVTTVKSGSGSTTLVTNKGYISSSPTEGGRIVGVPKPEYNRVSNITDVSIHPTLGLAITTDMAFSGSSEPIPGEITFVNTMTTDINKLTTPYKYIYNAKIKSLDYDVDSYDRYVLQTRDRAGNNISTILNNDERYRIEQSTKSWLLVHNSTAGYSERGWFNFYNAAGTLILNGFIENVSTNTSDFYVPVGIDQLLASANWNQVLAGPALSTIVDDVASYSITMADSSSDLVSNTITFELNQDCSRYDILHLMWKDELGSWLSYPFKYMSTESTEFERKTFYKKEGTFNNNSQTFEFDSFGRGEQSYFGRSRDKVNLNSGWINDFENRLIKDLLGSGEVLIQQPDGSLRGCIIENKSFTFKDKTQSDIYQYKIAVRLSSNELRF